MWFFFLFVFFFPFFFSPLTIICIFCPVRVVLTKGKANGRLLGPRADERDGGGHGRDRPVLPQIQGSAADSASHAEDPQRLHHPLDGRLLLRALGGGKETRRPQTGALGGHHQGVGHHFQKDCLD